MSQGYGKRLDANQPEIVNELRSIGFTVKSTAMVGHGFVDICVGFEGLNFLFEIKVDEKGKLTDDEEKFFNEWEGQTAVIHKTEQVIGETRRVFEMFLDSSEKLAALGKLHDREKKLFRKRSRKAAKNK